MGVAGSSRSGQRGSQWVMKWRVSANAMGERLAKRTAAQRHEAREVGRFVVLSGPVWSLCPSLIGLDSGEGVKGPV